MLEYEVSFVVMGRNNKKNVAKRKKMSSSGDELNLSKVSKVLGGPSSGSQKANCTGATDITNISVSDVLNKTNSILFEDSIVFSQDSVVFSQESSETSEAESDSVLGAEPIAKAGGISSCEPSMDLTSKPDTANAASPSNADIISYLQKIENKIGNVEEKLKTLDKLEAKVDNFEKDLKKLWLHMEAANKSVNEKISKLDDRVDNIEMTEGQQQSKLHQLETENCKLRDSISYLQSQSMRNNLVFCNIDEVPNEKPDETEKVLREFMVKNLKMAQEQIDAMKIERVHRMGNQLNANQSSGPRKIVCKFTLFKDRESIRRNSHALKGTKQFIYEQFPPDVAEKRRKLVPMLKQAKSEKKKAWISYDTLFVDGKPVSAK